METLTFDFDAAPAVVHERLGSALSALFTCSSAHRCERALTCLFAQPHQYDASAAGEPDTCHDIKPYVSGGQKVWQEAVPTTL